MTNKLEDLRLLHAVVQLGSFTRAAAHTSTTQSRVSRAVARLETELGVALIHRTSRQVAPTPAGRRYAEFARRALLELATVEASLRGEGARQTLSISTPPAVGRRLLASPIAAFAQSHPGVELNWSLGARRVDLIAEETDLTIRFGPLPDTWRRARTLLRGAYHIVAAPGLVHADHLPLDLSSGLEALPTLGLHVTHLRDRWPLRVGGEHTWLTVHPRHWTDDVDALIALTVAGLGATLLPDFLVREELDDGRLVCLTTPAQATRAEVFLVTRDEGTTATADALAAHLMTALEAYRPHQREVTER